LAQRLGVHPSYVSRLEAGRKQPGYPVLHRLVSELGDLYSPEEARLWLFSPHKQLGGERPADRIQQGKIEDVLTVIAQLKDGAYV